MTQGVRLDRQKIHETIWEARDKSGRVKIYQKRFAEALHISQYHMNRIIKEFEAQGRLKKIGARYQNIGIYTVVDPALFDGTAGLAKP